MSDTPERKFDQHFLQVFYGNEDKSEDSQLLWFKDKSRAAAYLRALADKIEEFESSKKYRNSDR